MTIADKLTTYAAGLKKGCYKKITKDPSLALEPAIDKTTLSASDYKIRHSKGQHLVSDMLDPSMTYLIMVSRNRRAG